MSCQLWKQRLTSTEYNMAYSHGWHRQQHPTTTETFTGLYIHLNSITATHYIRTLHHPFSAKYKPFVAYQLIPSLYLGIIFLVIDLVLIFMFLPLPCVVQVACSSPDHCLFINHVFCLLPAC